jgi:pyruvate/2-oxoglutarate dehydrogenase complex dihydrolipoamide acyltransferase (E2) component
MATEVKLPRLGQGMEAGTIVRWLKSEGDTVEKGEPLYELDTDKVTQEVEAEAGGVLLKIAIPEGEVEVGKTIAVIGEQGEKVGGGVADVRAASGAPAARDPEQSEQSHDVVEADAGRMRCRAPDRLDERLVVRAAQLPRVEWRQAPVLAVHEELIGWRADAHARCEQVLPAPGVEAVGGKADRHVGDEAYLARRARQLAVEVELLPHMEGNAAAEAATLRIDAVGLGMS